MQQELERFRADEVAWRALEPSAAFEVDATAQPESFPVVAARGGAAQVALVSRASHPDLYDAVMSYSRRVVREGTPSASRVTLSVASPPKEIELCCVVLPVASGVNAGSSLCPTIYYVYELSSDCADALVRSESDGDSQVHGTSQQPNLAGHSTYSRTAAFENLELRFALQRRQPFLRLFFDA